MNLKGLQIMVVVHGLVDMENNRIAVDLYLALFEWGYVIFQINGAEREIVRDENLGRLPHDLKLFIEFAHHII